MRGLLLVIIARLAPSLASDPAVKIVVEVASVVLAIVVMAWISTRSTGRYAGTLVGEVARRLNDEPAPTSTPTSTSEPPLLTGSRVGDPKGTSS